MFGFKNSRRGISWGPSMERSFYEMLGVARDADQAQIDAAYALAMERLNAGGVRGNAPAVNEAQLMHDRCGKASGRPLSARPPTRNPASRTGKPRAASRPPATTSPPTSSGPSSTRPRIGRLSIRRATSCPPPMPRSSSCTRSDAFSFTATSRWIPIPRRPWKASTGRCTTATLRPKA